jgi:hypothetical protein
MGWKIYDDAIDLLERRFHLFPQAFGWQGQRYDVVAVERCWTVVRRGWRHQVERHFFQVRCAEGTFELYQDAKSNTWHLRRAKLLRPPAAASRELATAWS